MGIQKYSRDKINQLYVKNNFISMNLTFKLHIQFKHLISYY